jgi:type VI secretion system protein ImpD
MMRPEGGFLAEGAAPAQSLFEAIGGIANLATPPREVDRLERFLTETDLCKALVLWFGRSGLQGLGTGRALQQRFARDIAAIDQLLAKQVDAILHHPEFQKLEASWRGLRHLVDAAADPRNEPISDPLNKDRPPKRVQVKVFNATWSELARDAARAVEFDQGVLFRRVYSEQFDMPGGSPFGVLLGDFRIRHRRSAEHREDDIQVLGSIAGVAAAAFAPFIASVHPTLLGVPTFGNLQGMTEEQLAGLFASDQHIAWRALRDSEDSRFVGLTLPYVLARLPYEDDGTRDDCFRYREQVAGGGGTDIGDYLWGSAVYAFGDVLIRTFLETSWFTEIRGGLARGLPAHPFSTDGPGIALKNSTDFSISQEQTFGEHGFMPLSPCPDTGSCAFFGNRSLHKPRKYDKPEATRNARISAMLQYMFCASRFAHYLKQIVRDKLGSTIDARELEDSVQSWIRGYVTPDASPSPNTRAQYPLQDASVTVTKVDGPSGRYDCVMHLQPHSQLDGVSASVTLKTQIRSVHP